MKEGSSVNFEYEGKEGFYCIQSGHFQINLGVTGSDGILRISGPGDLIGFETKNVVFATALVNAKVCLIEREGFQKLQSEVPEISNGIIQALIRIILAKNQRIVGLENHSVKSRVAATLLQLARQFGHSSDLGILIDVKFDRTALAKLSGTVVESLARTLTDLEEEKVIQRDGRRLRVLNLKKLEAAAKSA